MEGISILYDSPLKRGDKGVCKFAVTHHTPFSRGNSKAAAFGILIKTIGGKICNYKDAN